MKLLTVLTSGCVLGLAQETALSISDGFNLGRLNATEAVLEMACVCSSAGRGSR